MTEVGGGGAPGDGGADASACSPLLCYASWNRISVGLQSLHHNPNIASYVCRYKYINTIEPSVGIARPQIMCR